MLRGLAIAGTASIVIATCLLAGRPHRDKDIYYDTLAVGRFVPRQSTIGIAPELFADYAIQMYLARWDAIAPDFRAGNDYAAHAAALPEYCLAARDAAAPVGYTPVASDLLRYRLFERSAAAPQRIGLGEKPLRQ